jgi:hypothetical protein
LCLGPRVRICPQTFGGHSHRREAQIKSAGKKEARRLVATGLGELLPVSRRRGLRGRSFRPPQNLPTSTRTQAIGSAPVERSRTAGQNRGVVLKSPPLEVSTVITFLEDFKYLAVVTVALSMLWLRTGGLFLPGVLRSRGVSCVLSKGGGGLGCCTGSAGEPGWAAGLMILSIVPVTLAILIYTRILA